MKSLSVIIPAFNEAASLKLVLPEIIAFCNDRAFSLILVNDGSTDDTSHILSEYESSGQIKVIHHKVNRGYGGAIKSAIQSAQTDYVVTIDADGQHDPKDITTLYEALVSSDSDMVVGCRKGKDASAYRTFGKWIIRKIARILVPVNVSDLNSGMKIYDTKLAKAYLHLCPDSMAYSDVITLVFINQRHKVTEIPITIQKRRAGKSTINTGTAFQTILEIINIVMLFNPLRVFLPLSVAFVVIGLLWGLPFLYMGRGVSVGALLAILTGGLLFLLGLLAEQLSLIRKNQK